MKPETLTIIFSTLSYIFAGIAIVFCCLALHFRAQALQLRSKAEAKSGQPKKNLILASTSQYEFAIQNNLDSIAFLKNLKKHRTPALLTEAPIYSGLKADLKTQLHLLQKMHNPPLENLATFSAHYQKNPLISDHYFSNIYHTPLDAIGVLRRKVAHFQQAFLACNTHSTIH